MVDVIYRDIPTSIRGLTRENPDGSFTIILNARMNRETQVAAYKHELEHIRRGDHDCEDSADLIESKMRV
jgi:hypothetical protein